MRIRQLSTWAVSSVGLAILLAAGSACAARGGGVQSKVEPTPAAPAGQSEEPLPNYQTVKITLERTSCYGTCPVYTVSINQDGLVQYEGKMFVRVEGNQTRQIDPKKVRKLVALFLKADFFSMKDRYDQMAGPGGVKIGISDLPTTITSITLDKRFKRVEDYIGGPPELRQLEAEIDELAGTKEWIENTGNQPQNNLRPGNP